ncbi:S24 family peptidase [Lachnospiraceae bacterium 45-P1]
MKRSLILRQLMANRDMKVSDVSKQSGIAYSTVKSILENGTGKASYINICKICSSLGITPDELEHMAKENTISEFQISKKDSDLLNEYHSLDPYGQETIDAALTRESKRIEQYGKLGKRNVVILAEYEASKAPTHIIPYWEYGVSAGNGIYQLNDTTSVMMTLWATETTKQADFIIKVSGSSMEPDYHDGDKVLVDRKAVVQKGEVGIFVKSGDTYIKELGENELISRNTEFPNIPVKDFENVVCLGKVIGILTDSLIAEE